MAIYKERLQKIREERNLKLRDIDNILELNTDTYKVFESERTIIPTKHLNTLCNYFNVSFDFIFGFTQTTYYKSSNSKIDETKSAIRLKEFRKEFSLSQDELAKTISSAKTTISGYERGARIIALPFLYDICKKYKISADYLLGKTDFPKYLE